MPTYPLPAKTDLVGDPETYKFQEALGALYEHQKALLGATGSAAAARISLGINGPFEEVAAGSTTAVGATASANVLVSGAATINSLGAVDAGIGRRLYFSGACQLVKSANLVIHGGASWTTAAGDQADVISLGSGVWQVFPMPLAGLTGSDSAIQGAFRNLKAFSSGVGALINVTVDEINLRTDSNIYVTRRNLSLSGMLTSSGGNGLDNTSPQAVAVAISTPGVLTLSSHGFPANAPVVLSTTGALPTGLTAGTTYYVVAPTTNTFQLAATKGGTAINTSGGQSGVHSIASVLAPSSWYSRWIIDNGTTTALLWSSSATNPVLPNGYIAKAHCGWDITDSTANKFPLFSMQNGKSGSYKVGLGSNVIGLPQMASGAAGSVSTPTLVAIGISNFVPPTASKIHVCLVATGSQAAMLAPSNAYGAINSLLNPPPLSCNPGAYATAMGELVIESSNIYWASNGAGCAVYCYGWEDNL